MVKTKKQKTADFQKVKLKAGRVLKKSTNDFSGVSFKSKKILLAPQFLKFAPEKEFVGALMLLNELNHHNFNSRKKALRKIKTALGNGDFAPHELDIVIKKVLSVLSDDDLDVRNEALKVSKSLLQSLSSNEIKGNEASIVSHASLLMTHLNDNIRHDSLEFFDLLLDLFPRFVSSSTKLMSLFLELITCKNSPKGIRMMRIVPLKKRVNAVEWKMSVLKCIEKLLNALLRLQEEVKDESICFPCLAETSCMQIIVNATHLKGKFLVGDEALKVDDELVDFFCVLIIALSESYKEASHCYSKGLTESGTNADTHEFMSNTVKCLSMCACWINMLEKTELHGETVEIIKESISESVQSRLFSSFPMIFDETFLIKKKDPKSNDMSVMLNMELCKIFSFLLLDNEECSSLMTSILNFLLNIIRNQDTIMVDQMKMVILKSFLLSKTIAIETWDPFFKAMLDNYKLDSKQNWYKQLVSGFFLDLCTDDKFKALCKCKTLQLWLYELPRELLLVLTNNFVDEEHVKKCMALDFAVLPTFLDGLQGLTFEYIELLKSRNKYVQSIAIILVSNMPNINDESFNKISNFCMNPEVPFVPLKKLMIILNERFRNDKNPGFSDHTYHIFLLNLVVGAYPSYEDIECLDDMTRAIYDAIPADLCKYRLKPNLQINRHREVSNFALNLLEGLSGKYHIADSTIEMLLRFTTGTKCMPTNVALSILKIFSIFLKDHPYPSKDYDNLCKDVATLTIGLYLYEIALLKLDLSDEEKDNLSVLKELFKVLFNFGEIVQVMMSNLENIGSLENTSYYGTILYDLKGRCILAPEDMPRLKGLVRGFKAVYGEELICLQAWYKKLAEHPTTYSLKQ